MADTDTPPRAPESKSVELLAQAAVFAAAACQDVANVAMVEQDELPVECIHERNVLLAQALGALECREAILALRDTALARLRDAQEEG